MTTGSLRRPLHPSRRTLLAAGAAMATLPMPFVRARAAEPIRIGFPTPLTSAYREEALDQVRAAKVAIAMFNEQGGLNGQPAELVVRDDKLDPGTAIRETRDLIARERVSFIVGGLSASVQLAINGVAREQKVIFNSISQSNQITAVPDSSRYTFHEALTPHMTAGAVGRYVFPKFGKRVAFLAADYAYGDEMVRGFQVAGAPLGIRVVADLRHPIGTKDFLPYLPSIQDARPEVFIICNFGYDQQRSIEQASKLGLKATMKIVAPVLLYTARKNAGSEAYAGVVGGTSYYWRLEDTIESANTFNRRFRAMNDGRVPTDYGTLGFAGVMTVLTAARTAGTVDVDKVIEAMEGLKYDLYKGPEYYRACDHQAVQSTLIIESRDTTSPNDWDVFHIAQIDPPDEAALRTCAELGHG
jgi:branched-chain amino acid transport system substrate-binding protein